MYNQIITTINTNEKIQNNFWICIFHRNPITKLNNSFDKQHKIESLLNIGKVYELGKFPRFIVNDTQKSLILGEYSLEKERLLNYKDFPSRCSSVYVFQDLNNMMDCINLYKWHENNPIMLNVYINLDKPYNILKANMEIISSIRSGNKNNIPLSDYWKGEIYPILYNDGRCFQPIIELIVEGELLIINNSV